MNVDPKSLDELIHRRTLEITRGFDKRIKALEARVAELEQQRETVWAYLWRQAHAARRWWLRGATGAASS